MSKLKIITIPKHEQILRTKSEEFLLHKINLPETQKFFSDLKETMFNEDGAGLAAPQVGKLTRVICVNMSGQDQPRQDHHRQAQILINPKITRKSWVKCAMEEGCLSIPGVYGKVRRPKKIIVEYFDEQGHSKKQKFDKIPSRVIQHEVDHLDGILFVDRVNSKWCL